MDDRTVPAPPRSPVAAVGAALLCTAALTSTWNAVQVRGVAPSDLLLLSALGLLALDALARHQKVPLRPLVAVGAALVASAGLWSLLSPVSDTYESLRIVPASDVGVPRNLGPGDATQLVKFLVALVAVPIALQIADRSAGRLRAVAASWLASSVVSSLVALTDEGGVTAVSTGLRGAVDVTGRQAGLSSQPNHLAVGVALALPFALLWALRGRGAARVLAAGSVPLLLGGALVSGSRGGVAACLVALTVLAVHLTRKDARHVLVLVACSLLLLSLTWQRTLDALIGTRLTGESAQRSDSERLLLLGQAWRDFVHSPVHGVGFEHINAAHQVQLQLLSAGGLLALTGYALYILGVLSSVRAASRGDAMLTAAAITSVITWLLLGLVENQLIDRYLYIPAGVLLALAARDAQLSRPLVTRIGPTSRHRGSAPCVW